MPGKSFFSSLLLTSVLLSSCEFSCKVGSGEKDRGSKMEKNGASLYNGIRLNFQGIKVSKAYLVTNNEEADPIPEGNWVEDMQTGVKLVLQVPRGWEEADGKVWLGASMQVETDAGEKIIDQPDLFARYEKEGLSARDAKVVSLSFYVKDIDAVRNQTFRVSFRVWDKKGDGFVEGDYTVHTR